MKDRDSGELGRRGEELACHFLENKGHTIIERNCRAGHLEIDVISLDANGIHFVEVKTRTAPLQLEPEACVTLTKQKRLVRAAQAWLRKQNNPILAGLECSFDIIGIVYAKDNYIIRYLEQAFIPLYL